MAAINDLKSYGPGTNRKIDCNKKDRLLQEQSVFLYFQLNSGRIYWAGAAGAGAGAGAGA